jgi:hypothetical protein
MGQTCKAGVGSCMDCTSIGGQEIISEASRKFEIKAALSKEEHTDPVIHCVERLDKPLEYYEKEFLVVKKEKESKKLSSLDDSFRSRGSPRLKILSSNASEKSVNLIDKIDRTTETDKTSSSLFFSPQFK